MSSDHYNVSVITLGHCDQSLGNDGIRVKPHNGGFTPLTIPFECTMRLLYYILHIFLFSLVELFMK